MSWTVACFCGHVYAAPPDRCDVCGRSVDGACGAAASASHPRDATEPAPIVDQRSGSEAHRLSVEKNKAVVGRWSTDLWGSNFAPEVIDELAAPDIRFEHSLHQPLRGRDEVREFAVKFREAFPDLGFAGTAELIAEGDYVVGQWNGGGTHTGPAFDDLPIGALPAGSGKRMDSPERT